MNTETLDATAESVSESVDQPITMDNAPAESSPASGENHEQKTDGVQKRIDTLTAQKYEAKRETEALRAELAAAKADQPKPVDSGMPEAPELPADRFDDEAMKKYHNDMISYTNAAATAASTSTYENQQKTAREDRQRESMQQAVSTYANNAIRDGVDMDKLRVAEQSLNQAGIDPSLGKYIMDDVNGGKIVEYLHDNPALMHEVLALNPIDAGHKIKTEIKALALSTTPKVSNAPDPTPEIKGGGALDKDDFERNNPGTQFI